MFYIERILAIVAAFILLQTLYFKFIGAKESVDLFTRLGIEPWGRYVTAVLELFAGIFLLLPRKALVGAGLAIVVMVGALLSHIFILGFSGSDSSLALLAGIVLLCSMIVFSIRKKQQLKAS